jgi:hypothetical protein
LKFTPIHQNSESKNKREINFVFFVYHNKKSVHQRIADADEGGGQEDGGDVVNLFPFEVRSKLGR